MYSVFSHEILSSLLTLASKLKATFKWRKRFLHITHLKGERYIVGKVFGLLSFPGAKAHKMT